MSGRTSVNLQTDQAQVLQIKDTNNYIGVYNGANNLITLPKLNAITTGAKIENKNFVADSDSTPAVGVASNVLSYSSDVAGQVVAHAHNDKITLADGKLYKFGSKFYALKSASCKVVNFKADGSMDDCDASVVMTDNMLKIGETVFLKNGADAYFKKAPYSPGLTFDTASPRVYGLVHEGQIETVSFVIDADKKELRITKQSNEVKAECFVDGKVQTAIAECNQLAYDTDLKSVKHGSNLLFDTETMMYLSKNVVTKDATTNVVTFAGVSGVSSKFVLSSSGLGLFTWLGIAGGIAALLGLVIAMIIMKKKSEN